MQQTASFRRVIATSSDFFASSRVSSTRSETLSRLANWRLRAHFPKVSFVFNYFELILNYIPNFGAFICKSAHFFSFRRLALRRFVPDGQIQLLHK